MSETIIRKSLGDAIAPRYKMYALETLAERAIPDIRDGLKPVHLRILYCMYNDLNLTHSHKTIKSAKVSGAVMGSYHPHGDSYGRYGTTLEHEVSNSRDTRKYG